MANYITINHPSHHASSLFSLHYDFLLLISLEFIPRPTEVLCMMQAVDKIYFF